MAVKKIQSVNEATNTELDLTEAVIAEEVVTEGEVSDGVVTEGEAPKGEIGEGVVTEGEVTAGEGTDPVETDPVATDPPVSGACEKGKLYALPLTSVQPDPDQPRKFFDEQALAELAASIASHGVLQPILVRQATDGNFVIVSGERRYQAALKAGLATIPAILTDGEPAEISIIENLLRENLTAIEEAEAIERLRAGHGYGLGDLATTLGKAESTLSEILSLNRLPAEVKDDCRNDPKSARGILVVIAKQKTPEKMLALYTKYKESGLTRGEIRKKGTVQKPADAPIDLEFVTSFNNRLDNLIVAKLDAGLKNTLTQELIRLRGIINLKMKLMKA